MQAFQEASFEVNIVTSFFLRKYGLQSPTKTIPIMWTNLPNWENTELMSILIAALSCCSMLGWHRGGISLNFISVTAADLPLRYQMRADLFVQ